MKKNSYYQFKGYEIWLMLFIGVISIIMGILTEYLFLV